jgi:hypothetical protein
VDVGDALNEVVANDGGNAACAAGKAIDQRGLRVICRNIGDVFQAARVRLDEDGAIRCAARLFGIGVAGELWAGFEERGLEQLEIGETPYLIGGAGGVEHAHGGVGGERAIDLRQDNDTVRAIEDAGVRGIGGAGAANQLSLLV